MGDFAPGDVVVCVDAAPRKNGPGHVAACRQLRVGRAYRVIGLGLSKRSSYSLILHGLRARFHEAGYGFFPDRFRKIRPADDQFIRQIRATKPMLEDA